MSIFDCDEQQRGRRTEMTRITYQRPRRGGAACPHCGEMCSPHTTMPLDGGPRIRYFSCNCGKRFKSVGET